MEKSQLKYVYLVILSLIWGSSFILIKKALGQENGNLTLTPLQLGALRVILSGVILTVIGLSSFKKASKSDYLWLFIQ